MTKSSTNGPRASLAVLKTSAPNGPKASLRPLLKPKTPAPSGKPMDKLDTGGADVHDAIRKVHATGGAPLHGLDPGRRNIYAKGPKK